MIASEQEFNWRDDIPSSCEESDSLMSDNDFLNKNNFNFNSNSNGIQNAKGDSVDTILANELNNLTFHERESINDEIHGIDIDRKYIQDLGGVEETPEIISKSLNDMQSELKWICSTESGVGRTSFAFNRSQELYGSGPEDTYLNTNEFRLMFLRCERFDSKKAAKRMCLYADLMHEVYGDFALKRQTRLSDFDEEEMEIIKNGWSMALPGRDRAGRRIYMHLANNRQPSEKSRLKICAYCIMKILLSDVDSQRRGIVAIMWMHNNTNMDIGDFVLKGKTQNRHLLCLPLRVGAGHFCFQSKESAGGAAFTEIVSRFAAKVRPHVRIHSGSPMECVYILESFGISSKQHPLDMATGDTDLTNHLHWLKVVAEKEENPMKYKLIIECPNHSDILFGRGQYLMNHPGNTMFRNFIQCNLKIYSNLQTRKESTEWTWKAVRRLKTENGARFLKEERIGTDTTAWMEVSNDIARKKLRIAFRDAKTRQIKSLEKQKKAQAILDNEYSTNKPIPSNSTRSNGVSDSQVVLQTSILSSKRKISEPTIALHEQQPHDMSELRLNSNQVDTLNDNLTRLNNNLNAFVRVYSSSTSNILGLDGTNGSLDGSNGSNISKRQRYNCFG